ncbi:hypothetical protein HK102_005939 [Quaeritorhiza haematococci]|nr:hypothetical protein HK102_005939 [Quaeritorhiza haematococci]
MMFLRAIKKARWDSWVFFEESADKALERYNQHRGTYAEKVDAVMNALRGQPEIAAPVEQTAQALDQTQSASEYTFVTDLVVTNSDKMTIAAVDDSALQSFEIHLTVVVQELQSLSSAGEHDEVIQQATEIQQNVQSKGVGKNILLASLALLKALFSIVRNMSIRLLRAILELFWAVMMFEIRIPGLSFLWKYVISNHKYELSLMALTTLVPAIVYTYGYMLTHNGKPPFPVVPGWHTVLPPRVLPPSPGDTPASDVDSEEDQPQLQDTTERLPPNNAEQQDLGVQQTPPSPPVTSTALIPRSDFLHHGLQRRRLTRWHDIKEFMASVVLLTVAQVIAVTFFGPIVLAATVPIGALYLTLLLLYIIKPFFKKLANHTALGDAAFYERFRPAPTCAPGYAKRNNGCFLKNSQFTLEAQNTLITTYSRFLKDTSGGSNDLQPVTAHHVVFTVYGTAVDGSKVPVPGMPVEIRPADDDEKVLVVDDSTGEIRLRRLKTNHGFRSVSNAQGRVFFSFPIIKDDVKVQKMLVRAEFMQDGEWLTFHPDIAVINALGQISGEQIVKANPNLFPNTAESIADRVRKLVGVVIENDGRKYVDVNRQTIQLAPFWPQGNSSKHADDTPNGMNQLSVEEIRRVKSEALGNVTVERHGPKKYVKKIIKALKKAMGITVTPVDVVGEILESLLKRFRLTVKGIVDAAKHGTRWDEVVNTQLVFVKYLEYVRENIKTVLSTRRNAVYQTLSLFKTTFSESMESILKTLSGNHQIAESVSANLQALNSNHGRIAGYSLVSDLIITNGEKTTFSTPIGAEREYISKIETQLEILRDELQYFFADRKYDGLRKQIEALRRDLGSKAIFKEIVHRLIKLIQELFGLLGNTAEITSGISTAVLEATLELFWIIMTFRVHIPVVSLLYKHVISNGKYKLSMMGLVTLPPAIAHTSAYMLTHNGNAPFPDATVPPARLPSFILTYDLENHQQQQQQQKNFKEEQITSPQQVPATTNTNIPAQRLHRRASSREAIADLFETVLSSIILMGFSGILVGMQNYGVYGALAASFPISFILLSLFVIVLIEDN